MRHGTTAAFTLLEVMFAMTIIFIAIMATNVSMVTAKNVVSHSHSLEKVVEASESIIESIQARPYHQAAAFDDTTWAVAGVEALPPRSEVITIEVTPQAGNANISRIVIDAQWIEIDGPRTLTTEYYHINRGS